MILQPRQLFDRVASRFHASWRPVIFDGRRRPLSLCGVWFACTLAFAATVPTQVMAESAKQSFDVAADLAERSLKRLAVQSGLEIVFSTEVAGGVRTNPVKGDYSPFEAARRMVAGTDLEVTQKSADSAIVVSRKPITPPQKNGQRAALLNDDRPAVDGVPNADEQPITLSVFEVSSTSDKGYLSTNSVSASRTSAVLKDIPQSIFVLTDELIRDQAPLDLNDILRYAPGVVSNESSGESPMIRGLASGIPLVNGFRYPRSFPSEQADIERVEVLFGPASVLYGNIFGTGGVINRITKKPKFKPATSLQLQYKDEQFTRRAVLDTTAPFGRSDKFAYRLIVALQEADLVQDFSELNRLSILPKFLWRISETTSLTLEAGFNLQTGTTGNGVNDRRDYLLDGRIIEIPRRANPEQQFPDNTIRKYQIDFALTSKLSDRWSIRWAGLATTSLIQQDVVPVAPAIQPDGRTLRRGGNGGGGQYMTRDRATGNYFTQFDASGDYTFGGIRFKPIVGIDLSLDHDGAYTNRATTTLPNFNLFQPDYSAPRPSSFVFNRDFINHTFQQAIYGLAQVELFHERLLVNAGTRVTDFRQTSREARVSPESFTRSVINGSTTSVPRYGAVFRATPEINLYYGYSEGYQVQTAVNPDGTTLPPLEGRQKEGGVKALLFDGRISFTGAVFEIDQVNNRVPDPNRAGFNLPGNARRNTGYDFSVAATLTPTCQLIAGYTHAKGRNIADITADQIGVPIVGIAPHAYNLWTRYGFSQGVLKGLSLGFGTNYVDDTAVSVAGVNAPPAFLPDYQIYGAMLGYDWKRKIRLQVNLHNLTDERYYPNGTASTTTAFIVGLPRSVSVTATYRF